MGRHNKARLEYLKVKVKEMLDQGKMVTAIKERYGLSEPQYWTVYKAIGRQKEQPWGLSKTYKFMQGGVRNVDSRQG